MNRFSSNKQMNRFSSNKQMNRFRALASEIGILLALTASGHVLADELDADIEALARRQQAMSGELLKMQRQLMQSLQQNVRPEQAAPAVASQPGAQPGPARAGANRVPASSTPTPALDAASVQAERQTVDLLMSPEARAAAAAKDPAARDADRAVQELAPDAATREGIYGLASDVFQDLVKRTGGDPVLMMEEVEKAKRNPGAFANGWTPEQKAKLKGLSRSVETPAAPAK